MTEETWGQVKGFNDRYEVSNKGVVRNKETLKVLKPQINRYGYLQVNLYYGGHKTRKMITVHKLVATAFIPNPNNYPCINHKNEDKTDNMVENLEWCTVAYNNSYGGHNERVAQTRRKKYGKNNDKNKKK